MEASEVELRAPRAAEEANRGAAPVRSGAPLPHSNEGAASGARPKLEGRRQPNLHPRRERRKAKEAGSRAVLWVLVLRIGCRSRGETSFRRSRRHRKVTEASPDSTGRPLLRDSRAGTPRATRVSGTQARANANASEPGPAAMSGIHPMEGALGHEPCHPNQAAGKRVLMWQRAARTARRTCSPGDGLEIPHRRCCVTQGVRGHGVRFRPLSRRAQRVSSQRRSHSASPHCVGVVGAEVAAGSPPAAPSRR